MTLNETKKKRGRPPKNPEKVKRTREPTAYNLFVKEHLPMINAEHPNLDKTQKLQLISALWKKAKENA